VKDAVGGAADNVRHQVDDKEYQEDDEDYQEDDEDYQEDDEDDQMDSAEEDGTDYSSSCSRKYRPLPTKRGAIKHSASAISNLKRQTVKPSAAKAPSNLNIPIAATSSSLSSSFTFGSFSCSCASLPISQKRCTVLSLYGFYYHRELRCIVCPDHQRLVFLDQWASHVKRSHPGHNIKKKAEIEGMIEHVATSFGAPREDKDHILPAHLSEPVRIKNNQDSSKPSIMRRIACPAEGCDQWVASGTAKTSGIHNNLDKHFRTAHKKDSLKNYPLDSREIAWTQKLMITALPGKYYTFRLPQNWSPTELPALEHNLLSGPSAPMSSTSNQQTGLQSEASWMHSLGWSDYQASLELANVEYPQIQALIAPPGPRQVKRAKGSQKWLESGLLQVAELCERYLSDANIFLESCLTDVRESVTPGYVSVNL
jgi:hypothetical protein